MNKQILLTGATGALGPALAAELARSGAAERITVLMRTPPDELPQRFARWLEVVHTLLTPDEFPALARLHPVSGDICDDDLGASNPDLRCDTDVVIHAAADTNFASPPHKQSAVNVDGTRRTLAWAATCPKLRRFVLVSSVFVSGSRTGRVPETAIAESPGFVTHYQQTKWEAEHVALASGLPLGVARVSLVLGSHATGGVHRHGAVHRLIQWFSRGFVPLVPGLSETTADVIATEFAARCLCRAVTAEWTGSGPHIWHIAAGEHAPRMTELIDFVYDHFADRPAWRERGIVRPRLVDQLEYNRYIETVEADGHPVLAHALRSINSFLPDLFFPKTFETTSAEALWGGPLPRYDWRETMERVIRFCCPPEQVRNMCRKPSPV